MQFETEDKPDTSVEGGELGNGQLNTGEDTNGDGILNRRLVMIQPDGTRQVLGGSNNLADVTFGLSPDGSMLTATIVATMRLETGRARMLRYSLTSNIFLMN